MNKSLLIPESLKYFCDIVSISLCNARILDTIMNTSEAVSTWISFETLRAELEHPFLLHSKSFLGI